jgi:hemolysin activation/secretion protein
LKLPVLLWVVSAAVFTAATEGRAAERAAGESAAPRYEIRAVQIIYSAGQQGLPAAEELLGTPIGLRLVDGVYEPASDPATLTQKVTLGKIGEIEPHLFTAGAIGQMSQAIVAELNGRGIGGVSVSVDPAQFDENGKDVRAADDRSLRLVLKRLPVTAVRTEAYGERVSSDQAKSDPVHERIRSSSPVKDTVGGDGVLRTDLIDEYVRWLNRHPGRHVEAAVGGGLEPDTLAVNYLVQESKPWLVYAQGSNTGTKQTSRWRERFGFVDNQLTGNDDILQMDYSTANFETAHAFTGSYEGEVLDLERLRWRVSGSYSQYLASDIGFADSSFTGNTATVGGELIWNFYQRGDLFVDAVVGLLHERVEVNNKLAGVTTRGSEGFLMPSAGVRAQQVSEASSLFASAMFSGNAASLGGTDAGSASSLGRADVDASWAMFNWDLTYSMFLEPLFTGGLNQAKTLAHEVSVSFRGQQVIGDDRVIPQAEQTVGGLYTVRGYAESTSVGDNGQVWSAEYRFHVPQVFEPQPTAGELLGQPFRWAPQAERGRADWDVVLKTFIDYGRVTNNRIAPGERDENLLGAGVGVDFLFKRNFQLRVDWATALRDTHTTTEGSNRFHIVATIFY